MKTIKTLILFLFIASSLVAQTKELGGSSYFQKNILGVEVNNVKSFGATGNGTTNDATAIQAAINSSITTGKAVYFPVGTYKIATTLNVQITAGGIAGLNLIGDGDLSVINYTGTGTAIALKLVTAVFTKKIIFQNFKLTGTDSADYGIKLDSVSVNDNVSFKDLTISGFSRNTAWGIYIPRGAYNFLASHCLLFNNGNGIFLGDEAAEFRLENNWIRAFKGYGIKLAGTVGKLINTGVVTGNYIDEPDTSAQTYGVFLDYADAVNLTSNRFEESTANLYTGIYVQRSSHSYISANYFNVTTNNIYLASTANYTMVIGNRDGSGSVGTFSNNSTTTTRIERPENVAVDNILQAPLHINGALRLNTATTNLHILSAGMSTSTNLAGFNFVDTDKNLNRTTLAQATDTSSFSFRFSVTHKPIFQMKGSAAEVFRIDSNAVSAAGYDATFNGVQTATLTGNNTLLLRTLSNADITMTPNGSGKVVINSTLITQDSLITRNEVSSLADSASITIATGVAGWGEVMIGDNQEWAHFRFKADGTVTLILNSTNVATDGTTDNTLNIYDGGDGIIIKNLLGSRKKCAVKINYYTP